MHIGIAGAGLLGRLLTWQLMRAGHRVSVFDPATSPAPVPRSQAGDPYVPTAAGFTAAGMLSPLAELDNAEPAVAAPKTEESIATILDADGQFPASAATITVLPPQEEPVPEPTAPAPGSVTPVKAPKTGDNAMPGITMILMVAGAGTAMGLAKRKFD